MVLLDNIPLGNDIVWIEHRQIDKIYQSVTLTVGGGQNITVQEKLTGQLITLEATESQGWIPASIYSQLKQMAETPGGVFRFIYHDLEDCDVMFRHQDAPALALEPLLRGAEYHSWLIGTIKLFKV